MIHIDNQQVAMEISTKDKFKQYSQKHKIIIEETVGEDIQGQLEQCKKALKIQTLRSKQLIAAYSTKLREKEMEIEGLKRQNDIQLSSITKSLIALEASMKREQKAIKGQLIEKDEIIQRQEKLIAELRNKSKKPAKPPKPNFIKASVENKINLNNNKLTMINNLTQQNISLIVSPQRVSRMVEKFDICKNDCKASDGESEHSNIENIPISDIENSSDSCSSSDIRENFVEFHLDSDNSIEEEKSLITDDKQLNANNDIKNKNSSSYEGFLEATGLSQKSILTPSRVLLQSNNNHRNVLKPRDVKYRSKANRCFNNATIKYWAGPYL